MGRCQITSIWRPCVIAVLLCACASCGRPERPPGYDYVAGLVDLVHREVAQVDNTMRHQEPRTTVITGGDCRDKANLLWHLLDASGFESTIVTGRVPGQRLNHAWVEWRGYRLDPTWGEIERMEGG